MLPPPQQPPPPPPPPRYSQSELSKSREQASNNNNMATDGRPKDYSSLYREVEPTSKTLLQARSQHLNQPQKHQHQQASHQLKISQIKSDGVRHQPIHRESTVDLRAVVAKLRRLPSDNSYAIDALSRHYSSVFVNNRRRSSHQQQQATAQPQETFKTCIQYFEERQTYVVRVEANTLKAVKERLPKRGNYRYFFKQANNICEEVESDEASVPFHEKDNVKHIYCQLFPC